MTRALTVAFVVVLSVAFFGACFPVPPFCSGTRCAQCPEALTVTVVDSVSGAGVPGVEVVGRGPCNPEPCVPDAGECYSACIFNSGPGTYEFDLAAPGYESLHVVEQIAADDDASCCACGFTPRRVTVQLRKL